MAAGSARESGARSWPPRSRWPVWAYAALLSTSVVLGSNVVSGLLGGGLSLNYVRPLTWLDGFAIVALTGVVVVLVELLGRYVERVASRFAVVPPAWSQRRAAAVLGIAAALLAAWLPYILTYAPGSVLPDTLASLDPGTGVWDNHHPIAFTLLVQAFVRLGEALGSVNYGVFAYTCFQSVVMAVALGYGVVWMAKRGVHMWWCAASVAYFALVPVFPIYAINMQKDTLFSLSVMLLTLLVFDVVRSGGGLLATRRGIVAFVLLGVAVIFLKNNGIYIVVATAFAMTFVIRERRSRIAFAGVALGLVVGALLIQGPGYDRLGITKDTLIESVGVPVQQIAHVVATDGTLDTDQQAFVSTLLPLAVWKTSYAPGYVDPLKWHDEFDEKYLNAHSREFARVWFELLVSNPGAYFDAYLLQTFGFWKIGVNHSYNFADTYVVDNARGVVPVDLIERATGRSIMPLLTGLRGPEGNRGYLSVGLVVWLTLLSGALLVRNRTPGWAVVLVPCLALWLTVMVATPVAFGLRYVFALALCLPGFLVLPLAGGYARPTPS